MGTCPQSPSGKERAGPAGAEGCLLPCPGLPQCTPAGRRLPAAACSAGGRDPRHSSPLPLLTAVLAELVTSPRSSLNNPDSQGKRKQCFSNIIIVVLFSKRCLSATAQHALRGPSWGSLPSTRHATRRDGVRRGTLLRQQLAQREGTGHRLTRHLAPAGPPHVHVCDACAPVCGHRWTTRGLGASLRLPRGFRQWPERQGPTSRSKAPGPSCYWICGEGLQLEPRSFLCLRRRRVWGRVLPPSGCGGPGGLVGGLGTDSPISSVLGLESRASSSLLGIAPRRADGRGHGPLLAHGQAAATQDPPGG